MVGGQLGGVASAQRCGDMIELTLVIAVAIALQYSVFADDDNDDSPCFKRFKRLRTPLLAKIEAAREESTSFRQKYSEAYRDGRRQDALGHAASAYEADLEIHRLSREVELLARSALKATRDETSLYISRLPLTHAREAFERQMIALGFGLQRTVEEIAYDEQIILDSPAGARYAVLYVDKVLGGQPWGACESMVAQDSEWSHQYASVTGRRFELGEPSISTKPVLWDRYCRRFGISTNHGGAGGAASGAARKGGPA